MYKDLAKKQREVDAAPPQYRIQRQTIMCSATIPQRQHFAQTCFKNGWCETLPELIHVSPAQLLPPQVTFILSNVKKRFKNMPVLLAVVIIHVELL
jgi:superfamily II DNA/RNA helicase